MYSVYVLRSLKDNKLYIGFSSNLEKRMARHNTGKVKATRTRRPFKLVYSENYDTELEARRRELFLKSWAGRIWLKSKIQNGECSSIG
ncbi:MAG: GIY-YIG nuclease family protein [candidate division WOR-3 bacterium]